MNADVSILLGYRRLDTKEWVMHAMTPSEYFDLDPDELPELDCVPWYNHACDYLSVPRASLAATKILLSIEGSSERRTILETFWDEGKCRLIERLDEGPEPYRELIICSEVQADPNRLEILRLVDHLDQMKVTSHCIIETRADGTEFMVKESKFSGC